MIVHRLEERALRAGSRAIDFVGHHHLSEQRSRLKYELTRALIENTRADQVAR